jgi:CubicO group peptidase (beta-lactamase class C family)
MAGQFSDQAKAAMAKSMDDVTADPNRIPGCVAVVVDRFGRTLFSHASGKRGVDSNEPMTLENVFWIASCTKMIGGIAAMQLNEQGKLGLDDADAVERIAPELKTVRILKSVKDGRAEFVDKKTRITMRMLLTHTGTISITCTHLAFTDKF